MANKALQEIKAYAKYYYSNSTEIFNSTLPISSPTTSNSSSSGTSDTRDNTNSIPSTPNMTGGTLELGSGTIERLVGQYLKADVAIIIKAPDQFICKQSKLEAPEIYLPKEDLIHNDGCEFLGNIHYDDYPL